MMNMVILSNGSDSNANGIDDVLVFVNVDGVGVSSGTCKGMREKAEETLKAYGVEKDDILSFNISATHCHAALDTQGMSIPVIIVKIFNKALKLSDRERTLSKEMEATLYERVSSCADEAYNNMEKGSLSFFETDPVDGTHDKNNSGVKNKNTFSCFLFEGESGEKTLITNIGAHPTGYSASGNKMMMCPDYPYHMSVALKDAGYNMVFTQSAQAAVSSPGIDCEEGSQLDKDANEWIKQHALTKEDWTERYGKSFADKNYDDLEQEFENDMKNGYRLAHHIIDAADTKIDVAPVLNVKNTQFLLPLDNGLLAWGSISGLLGESVVKTDNSESGYGNVAEVNYIEIGNDIVIMTAPGELSPALVYGSVPEYSGTAFWNGKTSWTGETWGYDCLENLVREYTGDDDKIVLLYGITNDALGYMYPDICTTKSFLGAGMFYKENSNGMLNDMMLTTGRNAASTIMKHFIDVLESVN